MRRGACSPAPGSEPRVIAPGVFTRNTPPAPRTPDTKQPPGGVRAGDPRRPGRALPTAPLPPARRGSPRGARAPRRGHPGLTCGAPAAVHRKHPRLGSRRPECFGSGRARASVRFSAPRSAPNTHARARAFCRRKITIGMRCLSRRNVTSPKGL